MNQQYTSGGERSIASAQARSKVTHPLSSRCASHNIARVHVRVCEANSKYHVPALTKTTNVLGPMLVFLAVPPILALCSDAAHTSRSAAFQDDRIHVAVPSGWSAKEVTITTEGDQHIPVHTGGVLNKGKYRIYLLTHYGQASGIEGGRFGEIAEYVAPWMNSGDPWGCFDALIPSSTPVTALLSRVDLYFVSTPQPAPVNESCQHLHHPVRKPVWFGSYFSPTNTRVRYGFFLPFPPGEKEIDSDHEMVFTATFATKNPNDLPAQNDSELQAFLREASAIVSSIKYRH